MARRQKGDTVQLLDGSTAVIEVIRCNMCETNVAHEHCQLFYRIGEHRWVTDAALKED